MLIDAGRPVGAFAAGDNSLCRFFQGRAEFAPLCARDCGAADARDDAPFRCHAGLYVARTPLDKARAVIGGRAFLSRADYHALTERFRAGDLRASFTPEALNHVAWSSWPALNELNGKLSRWAALVEPESADDRAPSAPLPAEAEAASSAEAVSLAVVAPAVEVAATRAPEGLQVRGDLAETGAAALRALAEAHGLTNAAFLRRSAESFEVVAGLGLWAANADEIVCDPTDAFMLRAAETKGSVRLRRDKGRWDFVAGLSKPSARHPEAEIFPLLAGGEVTAAFLIAREGLTNDMRRAIAEYGGGLAWPLEAIELRQEVAVTRRADYAANFVKAVGAATGDPYALILQHLAHLLRAGRASLMVYEEESQELALKAGVGLPIPVAPELRMGLEEGVAGQALREGRPLLARDFAADTLPRASSR